MPAIDTEMVFIIKGRDREVDARSARFVRFGFGGLTVQRASRSFWRSLAGLSAQARGMRPSLMSRFSPSGLRCCGAATIKASMIGPLIAKNPAAKTGLGQPDRILPSRVAEMLEVDKAGRIVRC
jgi:hypothetical protein